MSPRWDGTATHKERVRVLFAGRQNEWLTPREVADAIGGMTEQQVRGAINNLVADGFLIRGRTGHSQPARASDRRTIQRVFRTKRAKRGFMATSKFKAMPLPEVIFIGDEPIVGPFCQHCGNPDHVHGLKGECLNYRIHPLLPSGDLPPAKRRLDA